MASEACKASQIYQLICKLSYYSLLSCKTLLVNANACIFAVVVCCSWLLLIAIPGFVALFS